MTESFKTTFRNFCCFYLLAIAIGGSHAQTTNCSKFQFRCRNGQCINNDELCDGKINCSDESDETLAECKDINCPDFAHKCAYGACVSGNAKCNGVQDCADNSDENCNTPAVVRGNCSKGRFQCQSGDCVSNEKVCDGKKDCVDASDETAKVCMGLECPAFAFRCSYGACVNGKARCNGAVECYDASDESIELCGEGHTTTLTPPVLTSPTTTTTTTTETFYDRDNSSNFISQGPTYSSHPSDGLSCRAIVKDNMQIVSDVDNRTRINNGEMVPQFQTINYRCQKSYVLFGPDKDTCFNGAWLNREPTTCSKVCQSTVIDGVTFKAECKYKGVGVDCQGLIRPQTTAVITCSIGYRKPLREVPEILVCQETGEWDYHPARCEPDCGKLAVDARPFVVGGEQVNITKVPWHVAIYQKMEDGRFAHICGGTIYRAKLIISAAHCFWDVKSERLVPAHSIRVVVGKEYRSYYKKDPLSTQFFNVSDIHVPFGYVGASRSFEYDIAVLVLNKFIRYNDHTKPICIRWEDYNYREIAPGTVGRIAGWGKINDREYAEDLRAVDLPAFRKDQCLGPKKEFETFVTGEKFCVGSPNDESVCEGDSGGGFVVANDINGVTTYYLKGVLSVGLGLKCEVEHLTTFTNIQYHKDMIDSYETRFRPK